MKPLDRCPRCGSQPLQGACPAGCINDFPLTQAGDNGQVLETDDQRLIPGDEPEA